jgi:hypothetical protein
MIFFAASAPPWSTRSACAMRNPVRSRFAQDFVAVLLPPRAPDAVESCGKASRLPQQVPARRSLPAPRRSFVAGINLQASISRTDVTLDLCPRRARLDR